MNSFADARELLDFIFTSYPESHPAAHVVLTRLQVLSCLPLAIARSENDEIGFTFVREERWATIEVCDDGDLVVATWIAGAPGGEGIGVKEIPNTEDAMYDAIREIQAWLQPLAAAGSAGC
jgi:hypothetical protein